MLRGVYFLANNKVYDLAIAFLNSFRMHNDAPLCLIPFDKEFDKIATLSEDYRFTIYDNKKVLNYCDEISRRFHGFTIGSYRKLSMWEGEFDEFIYIDVDTIVTNDVTFAFNGLEFCDVLTSHSNMPENVKWVWKDSIYKTGALSDEQIEFSTNTGFIVSTKQFVHFDEIGRYVDRGLALKEYMQLYCMEQPFLNYLFVTSGQRFNSLLYLFQTGIYRNVMFEAWAGEKGGIVKEGQIKFPNGMPVFLVHWAGFGRLKEFPYWDLWLYYRNVNNKLSPFAFDKRMNEARHLNLTL